jgi:phospholipid transport system substrate-binding protein
MKYHRLLLLLTILSCFSQRTVLASTEQAETRLKSTVNQVVTIAEHASDRLALAKGVKPTLESILSFETMTRRAVGPGWKQFTPDQQKEATELFTTLIIRTYTAKFTPGELPKITYKTASEPAPGRVEIPTTLVYNGSHYDVIYRMEETSGWRITDVIIEGVSMIANYRTQFDAEFTRGGAEAVIKALQRSVSNPQ